MAVDISKTVDKIVKLTEPEIIRTWYLSLIQ
jgi:hypothetical protein